MDFRILGILTRNPKRVFSSREALIEEVERLCNEELWSQAWSSNY